MDTFVKEDFMKKILKIVVILILIPTFIIGRFFYAVYASEYNCVLESEKVVVDSDSRSIRVGTYNIKSLDYGEGLDEFVNDVEGMDLDVICLQEVDRNSLRSNDMDMVKEMAEVAGYEFYHFYQTMWILDGYYGLGILSKYPITEVQSSLLPNSLIKEPRILTETKIQVGDKQFSIYNTHITYENNAIRRDQLNFVENHVDRSEYSILAGDFNTFGANKRLQLSDMDSVNADGRFKTFGSYYALDDIFYSNQLSLVEANVKTTSFSDHNLLYAEFNY